MLRIAILHMAERQRIVSVGKNPEGEVLRGFDLRQGVTQFDGLQAEVVGADPVEGGVVPRGMSGQGIVAAGPGEALVVRVGPTVGGRMPAVQILGEDTAPKFLFYF